jgi:hypothetical protein
MGKYKKAEKRLKTALKIVESIYLEKDKQISLKAMCICNLGEVSRYLNLPFFFFLIF